MDTLLYIYCKGENTIAHYDTREEIYSISMHRLLKKLSFSYGREYADQLKFCAKVLKIKQKIPLLLDVEKEILLFPLYGKRSKDNIYLQYGNISKLKVKENKTLVLFKDGSSLLVDVEIQALRRARYRCRTLLKKIREI